MLPTEKIKHYTESFTQFQVLKRNNYYSTVSFALITMLKAANVDCNDSDPIEILYAQAVKNIPGFSKLIPHLPDLPQLVIQLEGILLERVAFYQQLDLIEK